MLLLVLTSDAMIEIPECRVFLPDEDTFLSDAPLPLSTPPPVNITPFNHAQATNGNFLIFNFTQINKLTNNLTDSYH